jgi:hypothetical protein
MVSPFLKRRERDNEISESLRSQPTSEATVS